MVCGLMKKLLIILLFLIVLGGCMVCPEGQYWEYYFDFPHGDEITNVYNAWHWVISNTIYQQDEIDEWKTPEETYRDGFGDCEDRAILMMYLCYQYAEETPTLVKIDRIDTIHMIVEVDGILYDTERIIFGPIEELQYEILDTYTYGEAMYMAAYQL